MRWEYKTVMISFKDVMALDRELNRLGSEGWELVGLTTPTPTVAILAYVFKRQTKN